jgi:hypothetical protein
MLCLSFAGQHLLVLIVQLPKVVVLGRKTHNRFENVSVTGSKISRSIGRFTGQPVYSAYMRGVVLPLNSALWVGTMGEKHQIPSIKSTKETRPFNSGDNSTGTS